MDKDLYAVVGNPISHSKSPRIHSLFAEQTGEHLEYTAIQAPESGFSGVVTDFFARGGQGLNVTVPFKEEAWKMAGRRTRRAEKAGAANTLYMDQEKHLTADNTDGKGLVIDLVHNHGIVLAGARVLVLGAGGAVRGVLGPLLGEGLASLTLANRTPSKAQGLVSLFAEDANGATLEACGFEAPDAPFDVIINGTSASLQGNLPPVAPAVIGSHTVVYDMMYSLKPTCFNQWALDQGAVQVLDGLGMLVEQAAESFRVWRGIRPDTASVIDVLQTE